MSGVHVYRPVGFSARKVGRCPSCLGLRRMVVTVYEWHEPTWTCCACGTTESSGRRTSPTKARAAAAAWPHLPDWKTTLAALARHVDDPISPHPTRASGGR